MQDLHNTEARTACNGVQVQGTRQPEEPVGSDAATGKTSEGLPPGSHWPSCQMGGLGSIRYWTEHLTLSLIVVVILLKIVLVLLCEFVLILLVIKLAILLELALLLVIGLNIKLFLASLERDDD